MRFSSAARSGSTHSCSGRPRRVTDSLSSACPSSRSVRVDQEGFGSAERACHVREAHVELVLVRIGPLRRRLVGELGEQRGQHVVRPERGVGSPHHEAPEPRLDGRTLDQTRPAPQLGSQLRKIAGEIQMIRQRGGRPREQRGIGVADLPQPGLESRNEVVDTVSIVRRTASERRAAACRRKVVEDQLGRLSSPNQRLPNVPRAPGDPQRSASVRGELRDELHQSSHDAEQRRLACGRREQRLGEMT